MNGFLVEDEEEIKEKIIQFYNDRDLLDNFSGNSIKVLKQKFSLNKHFEEIEKDLSVNEINHLTNNDYNLFNKSY
ncbi:hypothetical protein [Cytobacillus oceanisediminis]|uniref:hypothetical protein n=1 Tax=Cytobacillus oceanisediminis TaxID=665099 RepID=UPI000D70DC8C|nr:hypothetical protein [Cytobacillus oceanisediminis]